MFNVGDRLLCTDAWHPLVGKEVTVLRCFLGNVLKDWFVDVQTDEGYIIKTPIQSRFKLVESDGKSPVERKIKRMYERQYRKTGYAYLL